MCWHRLYRNVLTLILAGCFSLGLSACQSLSPTKTTPLQALVERGELRVGVTAEQAPLNMYNQSGELMGLDIEIVEALAQAMGLTVSYEVMPFSKLLPSVESGNLDMAVSGITITPERNARVAFAGPYLISGKVALTKSREIADALSVKELNKDQYTFAAVNGTTSVDFAKHSLPNAKLVTSDNYNDAIQLVIDNKVDAFLADDPVCRLATWRNPDAGLLVQHTPLTVEPLGIALPANAPLLVNLVENYLEMLEYTGLLGQYKANWLTNGSWVSEIR